MVECDNQSVPLEDSDASLIVARGWWVGNSSLLVKLVVAGGHFCNLQRLANCELRRGESGRWRGCPLRVVTTPVILSQMVSSAMTVLWQRAADLVAPSRDAALGGRRV